MDILKAILMERGMSIKEFCEKADISRKTINPYLGGRAKWSNATAGLVLKVSDTLGIDPHTLVNGKVEINIKE